MNSEVITPAQLLRKVKIITFDFSQWGRAGVEKHRGRAPTCAPGCSWCCYAKVMIDGGQGAMIFLELHASGRWTPALQERLRLADEAISGTTHADWLPQRIPCVFLKEREPGRGRCTVYPVRPINCAGTFSVTEDPAACGIPGGTGALMHVLPERGTEGSRGLIHYQEALLKAWGETKLWCMTIPGAVLYAAAKLQGLPPPAVLRVAQEDWEAAQTGQGFEDYADAEGVAAARARSANPSE